MLSANDHVQVVRSAQESNPLAACLDQMERRLIGSLITIGYHLGELIWQTGPGKEDQRDAHFMQILEMTIVYRLL